ncbi:hypothetical protein [Herbaspirillum rubrisubalbicans]|nr:hypothetical protein [Herbaspirillum rubrisubalbicans]
MRRALLYLLIAYTLVVDVAAASFIVSVAMHKHLPSCAWTKLNKGIE